MEIKALHSKIKVIWGWFEEIRKVLRVSREFSTNEQDISLTKANEIEPDFNDVLMKIREEGRKIGGEYAEISKRILQNCHDHMDELFVKVKDINGEEIRIVRNNGVEELNQVTESEVLEARRLIRTFPQSPLIRSDAERPGILREFIRLIDDAFEDVLDRDVDGWLSNF